MPDKPFDLVVQYLTPEDIAKQLRVKEQTVYNWLRSGYLPGLQLKGRLWRIHPDDYAEFLNENRHTKTNVS